MIDDEAGFRGLHEASDHAREVDEAARCRRCSECPDGPHHWITNDEDISPGAPDYICKHCDHGYAWMCIDCDTALPEPDTVCSECSNDGALDEEDAP